ncbi:MAG: hypothetical protein KJ077_35735 [Anaerolineae bacterium]|nr:hypothetical protein [Anaerolineae bacterium]
MAKKKIPFKIELTGQAAGPLEDDLTLLLEVMRTIARDFGIRIDYPAMIYLDDASDEVARRGQSPQGDDLEEMPHGDHPLPNPDR